MAVKIKKILCAVDLVDKYAPEVADYAAALGKAFDAEVLVFYVMPSLNMVLSGVPVDMNSVGAMSTNMRNTAESTMAPFLKNHFEGVKVNGKISEGEAAYEIMDLAKAERADLIVMGTHGFKGVKRLIFGSVAEKVIKNSQLPVLTISPD